MTPAYRDRMNERLILALLRAKRKVKHHDLELTKELHELQRLLEAEYGEYGVVLADEHDCEPGYTPEFPFEKR